MFRETSPLPALIPLSAYQSETHDDGDDDDDDDNDGDDDTIGWPPKLL